MAHTRDTILLVDDHTDLTDGLRGVLTAAGYHVERAANGREALEKLHGGLRPCVIVLDLAMPMVTGYAFRQEQMAYAEFSKIPVALFSTSPDLTATARELDVVAYAAKPIDSDEVLAIIRRYCRK